MSNALYVNKPGGVIVHLNDGRSDNLAYGAVVPVDQLADHVDPSTFSDGQQRLGAQDADLVAAAQRRAALTENGQINSSSSPVPGNYGDLDEDGAVQLVSNLSRFPESQAAVLLHEILYGGNRQRVLDAGTEYARISAAAQLAADLQTLRARPPVQGAPVSGLGDPDGDGRDLAVARAAEALKSATTPGPTGGDAESGSGAPEQVQLSAEEQAAVDKLRGTQDGGGDVIGFDNDDVTVPELDAYAEQHEVEGYKKSAAKDEKVEFLKNAFPDGPVTPLKS